MGESRQDRKGASQPDPFAISVDNPAMSLNLFSQQAYPLLLLRRHFAPGRKHVFSCPFPGAHLYTLREFLLPVLLFRAESTRNAICILRLVFNAL